ncbi:hypothetical protein AAFF_G00130140 [Aldrovandia affinis]|uniref:Uncharacterized protein n=1 Tax=Aldrovandia affinis TaxID=143900 RepID=A0AAD7W9E1_9TELE|nr:hypothetical protein AAFF_G00130140 [Aldrovandia affinis]
MAAAGVIEPSDSPWAAPAVLFKKKDDSWSGVRQKWASDTRCRGQVFAPGDQVRIFCPSRTKGVSPKLRSRWRGPGEVLQWLREVVHRVRMPGRGREVVLHQDRLAPYRPLAQPAAEAAGESPRPLSPETLSVRLGEAGGEPDGRRTRRHI